MSVEAARSMLRAFNERDWEGLKSHFAPDVVWTQFTDVPDTGIFRGPAGVVDGMLRGQWIDQFPDMVATIDELIDAGDHVAALGAVRGSGRASGLDVHVRFVHLYHFANGRVVEVQDLAGESLPS